MANALSLTRAKIEELMSGWEGVALTQDVIAAIIAQLTVEVGNQGGILGNFTGTILPDIQANLDAASAAVSDLTTNVIPTLDLNLGHNTLAIENLNASVIPDLQERLSDNIVLVSESPKVFVQPDEPDNPDTNNRMLVVGDVWHDSDDNNKQTIWNGTEWVTFSIDIPDFSITMQKLVSSRHIIY